VLLEVTESETTGNPRAVGANGSGLLGMRERVEAHGGELSLAFEPALSLRAWMPAHA
jgi:signal transduction histidine kinase